MPVRSLGSSVLRWPDLDEVSEAVELWARKEIPKHPELLRIGYFGSAARSEWGVGSDLDLIAVVSKSSQPYERRGLSWDLTSLPVPSDLLVYTESEWTALQRGGGRFARTLARETVWLYTKE